MRRPAGFRVLISPFETRDDGAGGQAGDDLAAQTLGCFGTRGHRPLLRLQLGDGILQSGRQQRRLDRVRPRPPAACRAPQPSGRSKANVSTATRQATIAVRPISAYADGEIFIGTSGLRREAVPRRDLADLLADRVDDWPRAPRP